MVAVFLPDEIPLTLDRLRRWQTWPLSVAHATAPAKTAAMTRLGDIGRALGITAIAAGKLLELLGYRSNKHVTDAAVSAGCGVRRWDGFAMHDDWHLERAVAAIRSAAKVPSNPAVADALAA
jgi:hypothetical protein